MYYRVCYPGRWNALLNIEIGNIYTIDVFYVIVCPTIKHLLIVIMYFARCSPASMYHV